MAKPITTVQSPEPTPQQQNEQTLNQLIGTLIENADGVKQTAKLLQELNGSGILPALQALLEAKEQVAEIAVNQMLRPPVTNMMNNAMAAAGALTSIEPETTKKLMASLAEGLKKSAARIVGQRNYQRVDPDESHDGPGHKSRIDLRAEPAQRPGPRIKRIGACLMTSKWNRNVIQSAQFMMNVSLIAVMLVLLCLMVKEVVSIAVLAWHGSSQVHEVLAEVVNFFFVFRVRLNDRGLF